MPVYNEKYMKVKVKELIVNTNIWGDIVPKEGRDHTCIACISIDSVKKIEKKKLSGSLFRRTPVENKEDEDTWMYRS